MAGHTGQWCERRIRDGVSSVESGSHEQREQAARPRGGQSRRGGMLRTARAVLSVVLILGGAGLIVYGAKYNVVTVYVEEEITPPAPPRPPVPPPSSSFLDRLRPGRGVPPPPFLAPPPAPLPAKLKVLHRFEDREPVIVRDVTVGALARADGRILRTPLGEGQALCPT